MMCVFILFRIKSIRPIVEIIIFDEIGVRRDCDLIVFEFSFN